MDKGVEVRVHIGCVRKARGNQEEEEQRECYLQCEHTEKYRTAMKFCLHNGLSFPFYNFAVYNAYLLVGAVRNRVVVGDHDERHLLFPYNVL